MLPMAVAGSGVLPSPSVRGIGSAVSSPSGARGEVRAEIVFFGFLIPQKASAWEVGSLTAFDG